ncbi:MAG: hypothetical protein QOH12_2135 [Solirubrobacteraceae bacterium]|jgi:hypothetical protein|nr:hypothetical protein [Solirubrobacteraceae bacterium]
MSRSVGIPFRRVLYVDRHRPDDEIGQLLAASSIVAFSPMHSVLPVMMSRAVFSMTHLFGDRDRLDTRLRRGKSHRVSGTVGAHEPGRARLADRPRVTASPESVLVT